MLKILQKNKFYKILIGVMVLLCGGLNVYAAWGKVKSTANYNDANETVTLTVSTEAYGSQAAKIQSFTLIRCLSSSNNPYNVKDFYFSEKNTKESATFSVKGWPDGHYYCDYALDLTNNLPDGDYNFTFNKTSQGCHTFKEKSKCDNAVTNCGWNSTKKECYAFKAFNDVTNCVKYNYFWDGAICHKTKTNCIKGYVANGNKCVKSSGGVEPQTSTFKVQFDEYGGYGLACDAGFTVPSGKTGICEKNVKAGETVTYPKTSSTMSKGDNLLIGWSKIKDNCNKGVVEKDLSKVETINASTNFYACYQEDIGDNRFVMANSSADGSESFPCGTSVYLQYCTLDNSGGYCYYYDNATGSYKKLYRDKITGTYEAATAGCESNSSDPVVKNDLQYVLTNGKNFSCGAKLNITSCTDTYCTYSKIVTDTSVTIDDGTIDKQFLTTDLSKVNKECNDLEKEEDEFDNISKCSGEYKNKTVSDRTGKRTYKLCYSEKNIGENYNSSILKEISKYYSCAKGYSITEVKNEDNAMNCNEKYGICYNNISVTCSKPKNESKPNLSVTSGIAQNGVGVISVKAAAKEGRIDSYYFSPIYKAPTQSAKWIKVESDSFTITREPGVIYIWVMDSKGNISNAVTGAVIDTVNTNTTISDLEVYDSNGNLKTPVSSVSYKDTIKSSNYVLMSNDLGKDSEVLADGFNPFDMEYKLEVESPTLAVYATLTSKDSSYVPGYEPRTVNLEYGVNTILIKIINKEGITRTYTILATRVDDRTSDNTLSNLTVSEGNITFNSNVTDYKVEISKDTKSVDVNATIGSDKAGYVNGYEPGNVKITGDTTVKLIKVKSETGSTRTYVITFVKKGTDIIEKESLQLADLVISDVNIPFEKNISNYSISVGYETDVIDIITTKMNKDSIVAISIKRKSESSYSTSSGTGMALDVGENFIELKVINSENEVSYYRITIIRKEFGLEISNDTTLKDLKVLGYDNAIEFNPNKKEYTVKIKQEKTLVITAVPLSNRSEVFIRGNDELTGFSTVRVKVVAENGEYDTYSIDIKKDAFNKPIEIASIVAGIVIILVGSGIIIIKKKNKARKDYFEE